MLGLCVFACTMCAAAIEAVENRVRRALYHLELGTDVTMPAKIGQAVALHHVKTTKAGAIPPLVVSNTGSNLGACCVLFVVLHAGE